MKMIVKGTLLSLAVLTLGGCAGMNGNFDCNKTHNRSSCMSLDEAYAQAGNNGSNDSSDGNTKSVPASAPQPFKGTPSFYGDMPTEEPLRYGETIQNVWIANYTDTNGNYNWPSTVTIIVKPGHWIGSPPKAIQDSEE